MDTKGAILRRRIKQQGFRQADFADKCEISLSALKKYITDKLPYSITLLEKFSEILDCSTDFLLGKTDTPFKEIQDLKDLTHLSDKAILNLKMNAADYEIKVADEYDEHRKKIAEDALVTISLLLENDLFIDAIRDYLYFDKEDTTFFRSFSSGFSLSNFSQIGGVTIKQSDIDGILLVNIMKSIIHLKDDFDRLNEKQVFLTREAPNNEIKKSAGEWLDPQEE